MATAAQNTASGYRQSTVMPSPSALTAERRGRGQVGPVQGQFRGGAAELKRDAGDPGGERRARQPAVRSLGRAQHAAQISDERNDEGDGRDTGDGPRRGEGLAAVAASD